MTVVIGVEFTQRTYRGRDGRPGRVAWPPSPARLAGALLAGAHALSSECGVVDSQCEAARTALTHLCAAGQPWIVAPPPPREFDANRTQWYAANHIDDEKSTARGAALRGAVEPPVGADAKNKVVKERVLALLLSGSTIHYLVDTDLADIGLQQALAEAAAAVPFFGSASDQALFTVSFDDTPVDEVCEKLTQRAPAGSGLHVWRPVPAQVQSQRDGRVLRGWGEATVAFYDAVHQRGSAPVAGDVRIPDTRYRIDDVYSTADVTDAVPSAVESEQVYPALIREFAAGPVSLRSFAELAAGIAERLDGVEAQLLPALDRNRRDLVRGVVFAGPGRWDALHAAAEIVVADPISDAVSMRPATWCGPSPLWESATPVASHRDPVIARAHIEHDLHDHGLRLVAMGMKPWRRWQSKRLALGSEYALWFVTAEADQAITGPISIGSCRETGAGLLHPTDTLAVTR